MSKLLLIIAWVGSALFPAQPIQNTLGYQTLHSVAADVESSTEYDCCAGDEEDPIIWATVQNTSMTAVPNADVDVYDNSTSTYLGSTTTDVDGDFTVRVPAGHYYFEITPPASSTETTQVYHITVSTPLTITI